MQILYAGDSMYPTLRSLDRLHVVPYGGRMVRRGDLVVFSPPGTTRTITHRVVSVGPCGIVTRGDNSLRDDQWVLGREDIIGRVTCAYRGRKRVRVYEGRAGRAYSLSLRPISLSRLLPVFLFRPAYLGLARTGFFHGLLPSIVKPRFITYRRPAGVETHLVIGRWVIGQNFPEEGRWRIRPPFKLFIDERALPLDVCTPDATAEATSPDDSIPCVPNDHPNG